MHVRVPLSLGKIIIAPLAALLFGLVLTSSALAGGGPGPGPEYITLTPGAFALTPHGEVVMSGTVTCTLPGEAMIWVGVQEIAGKIVSDNPYDFQYHGLLISGSNSLLVECPEPGVHDVNLVITGDAARGFRPGPVQVPLEFESVAYDPATGYSYPSQQFGIIPVDLTP